ncbi:MAG: hypothetical protein ABFD96_18240 [Armatimonadia bacterium]
MKLGLKLTMAAIVLVLSVGALAAAEPLVRNGGFAPGADKGRLPEGWSVPAGGGWYGTDADGRMGNDSLQYAATVASAALPVTQTLSLPAHVDLVLRCAMKSDGASKPVVRLRMAGAEGVELVRLVGEAPAGVWRQYAAEFNTGNGGEAIVELWTDLTRLHSPERRAPAGKVGFDEVQVVSRQEAQALRTAQAGGTAYENVARGKSYTLQPTPGYPHCTDTGDSTQLTDGQYTVGYFWTQKSTVGWVRMQDLVITLDLGAEYPIRGLSLNSAAGIAGVKWPAAIRVLVSVDGRAYHELGDLLKLSSTPPAPDGTYTVQRFQTDALKTHGRYVKLLITPVGNCTFVDEIEVYRGDEAFKQVALPGKAVNYAPEYFDADPFMANLKRRMGKDLETVRTAIEQEKLPATVRQGLARQAERLDGDIREVPVVDPATFGGLLPFNAVHERVYGLLGTARAALGRAPVVAWRANPWDYLTPAELPASPPAPMLSVAAMQGETRACALNLTNCTAKALTAELRLEGLAAECVRVHEVAWTDTPEGVVVGAALPELTAREGRYELALPAGMTQQVWLSITAAGLKPGKHTGALVVEGATAKPLRVPVTVRVFDLQFPAQPRLHVGGWDYTDGNLYGVTPQNRAAFLAHLQSRFVDSPWATSGVMGFGEFDAAGQFTKPPRTGSFDNWVKDWPQARRYHVFKRVDAGGELKIDDPLFDAKVGTWIRFWVAHLKTLGIGPERLFVLLVDESQNVEDDRMIIAWSRAIKAAEPEVSIWDDGTRELERCTPEILAAVDYMCPHRPSLLAEKNAAVKAVYQRQKEAGKGIYMYSCWGPTRTLDPYAYYRLQAWSAFELGGEGSFFWALGSNGGKSSWNAYVQQDTSYTPLFMDKDSVTAGKHMEAIRESVGDFEYLCMLRDRVSEFEKQEPKHKLLPRAKALLAGVPGRVLSSRGATIDGYNVSEMRWAAPRDRGAADAVRIEIGEMLEKLR